MKPWEPPPDPRTPVSEPNPWPILAGIVLLLGGIFLIAFLVAS